MLMTLHFETTERQETLYKLNHMKPILIIIAPKDFRDEEFFETKEELEESGYATVTASISKGICLGSKGGKTISERAIEEVETKDYEAVVFIGGTGSEIFFNNANAHRIVKEMNADEKIIAAICIAPVIIAKSGLLKNIKATVYASEIDSIKRYGAIYSGLAVSQDGNIITANGPKSARAFGQFIAKAIAQHKKKLEHNSRLK